MVNAPLVKIYLNSKITMTPKGDTKTIKTKVIQTRVNELLMTN